MICDFNPPGLNSPRWWRITHGPTALVNYRRNLVPGATFFFTVALADRRSNALTANIALLRTSFRKARSERPFFIDAIVVLPEHLHAILTLPPGDTNFPLLWRRIKTVFTQGLIESGATLPQRDATGRTLWQRRFWEHTIRDNADLSRHIDYIHYNPVKHSLATTPTGWPYSSLHRFIREGICAKDCGGPAGDGLCGEP
jgi:putative transposase